VDVIDLQDILPAQQARVLVALVRVYARDGRATVARVAQEAGRSTSATHYWLLDLEDRGLVAHEFPGTLRPLLVAVSLNQQAAA